MRLRDHAAHLHRHGAALNSCFEGRQLPADTQSTATALTSPSSAGSARASPKKTGSGMEPNDANTARASDPARRPAA